MLRLPMITSTVAALAFLGSNSLMTGPIIEKIKCAQNSYTGAWTGCSDKQIQQKTGIDPTKGGDQTATTTKSTPRSPGGRR
jgi:hypothetical protein